MCTLDSFIASLAVMCASLGLRSTLLQIFHAVHLIHFSRRLKGLNCRVSFRYNSLPLLVFESIFGFAFGTVRLFDQLGPLKRFAAPTLHVLQNLVTV
jgi:hypothetical protein